MKMTGMSLTVSDSDKTFALNNTGHSSSTAYKFRITSDAKDVAGNSVSTHTVSYTTQWTPNKQQIQSAYISSLYLKLRPEIKNINDYEKVAPTVIKEILIEGLIKAGMPNE